MPYRKIPKKTQKKKKVLSAGEMHAKILEQFYSPARAVFFKTMAEKLAFSWRGKLTRKFKNELERQVKGKLVEAQEFEKLPEEMKIKLAKADLMLFQDQHKKVIEDYFKVEFRRLLHGIDLSKISKAELLKKIANLKKRVIEEMTETMIEEYCAKYLQDAIPTAIENEFRKFINRVLNEYIKRGFLR